jgi:zinc protease
MKTNLLALICKVLIIALFVVSPVLANPHIQTWTLDNGVRVYYVPAPELPILDMRVVFDAGAARDGELPGLALLTNAMFNEGAGGLDADEIASRFESMGAQFGNNSQQDMALLELRTLSLTAAGEKNFHEAISLFTTILTQPDFPTDAFEREQRRLLISLQQQKQDADALADIAFTQAVFGNHPYHTQPTGTEETVKTISIKDLQQFYKNYYVGSNAIFAIVGDIDRQGAEQLAQQVAGKLPAGEAAAPLPEVMPLSEGKEIRINHPSTQTHILLGQPGMDRKDPDYFALYVGNHMLGGSGLVARLSNEVREKRGLAYSTYSYFIPMRKAGPYTIGAQTKNESAQETLQVLRDTLREFIEQGPTAEELEASKKNITGGFPLRVASNDKILDYIAMIGFYDLPLDYLDTFNARVQAVTAEDIKRAFQNRVHLDKMVTVMVGGNDSAVANNNN